MKIIVLSRPQAESMNAQLGDVCISIRNRTQENAQLRGFTDVLWLEFDDLDVVGHESDVLFTAEQAQQILDFFHKHKETAPVMIVHCQAGLSRSPAVAIALTEMFRANGPTRSQYPHFNRWVHSTMLMAHEGPEPGPRKKKEASDA